MDDNAHYTPSNIPFEFEKGFPKTVRWTKPVLPRISFNVTIRRWIREKLEGVLGIRGNGERPGYGATVIGERAMVGEEGAGDPGSNHCIGVTTPALRLDKASNGGPNADGSGGARALVGIIRISS
mmetsp:Transcript_842/g.1788  ORF Transcript_842/g.1788 Transcript_842/m.1788 type:complete len:125 (+) Transcript_842:314-688(+)